MKEGFLGDVCKSITVVDIPEENVKITEIK